MFYEKYYSHVEALLFASGEPVTVERLAKLLDIPVDHIEDIIFDLKEEFAKPMHGLTIRHIAGGYQLCSKKELAETVEKLAQAQENKFSPATMETLAIVAFRQPVTKQEIEHIRGVKSDKIINSLLDLKFVREAGRKDAAGRPILYATTKDFLAAFGMNSLLDLPKLPKELFAETDVEADIEETLQEK